MGGGRPGPALFLPVSPRGHDIEGRGRFICTPTPLDPARRREEPARGVLPEGPFTLTIVFV